MADIVYLQSSNDDPCVVYSLTQGFSCVVDAEDVPRLARYSWHVTGDPHDHPYAMAHVDGRHMQMHRFLVNAPDELVVDHINRDTLDNRKSNLRICTQTENMRNTRANVVQPVWLAPLIPRDGLPVVGVVTPILSDRETEVFRGVVAGEKNTEIAQRLNLNQSTVATYRARLFSKLGIRRTAEAVLLAVRYGIVKERGAPGL